MELEWLITLSDLLKGHIPIGVELVKSFRPLAVFREYLKYGYFPFYKEDKEIISTAAETVNTVIEVDLPANIDIEYQTIIKIKKLFSIIILKCPFQTKYQQTG